jgi:hypothetical protein
VKRISLIARDAYTDVGGTTPWTGEVDIVRNIIIETMSGTRLSSETTAAISVLLTPLLSKADS